MKKERINSNQGGVSNGSNKMNKTYRYGFTKPLS
jgi:hypothetical protein